MQPAEPSALVDTVAPLEMVPELGAPLEFSVEDDRGKVGAVEKLQHIGTLMAVIGRVEILERSDLLADCVRYRLGGRRWRGSPAPHVD